MSDIEIAASTVIARADGVVGSRVEDEYILMSMEAGTFNLLDGPAAEIWEQLNEPRSFDAIVDELLIQFEVSKSECEEDCKEMLTEMATQNLVTLT